MLELPPYHGTVALCVCPPKVTLQVASPGKPDSVNVIGIAKPADTEPEPETLRVVELLLELPTETEPEVLQPVKLQP